MKQYLVLRDGKPTIEPEDDILIDLAEGNAPQRAYSLDLEEHFTNLLAVIIENDDIRENGLEKLMLICISAGWDLHQNS